MMYCSAPTRLSGTRLRGLVLVVVFCSFPAAADQSKLSGAESNLNGAFQRKILVIRNFYEGSRLEYTADGTLQRGGKPGYWTSDGKVEIKRIRVRREALEIDARRVWFTYDEDSKQLQAHKGPSVEIRIQFDPDTATMESVLNAMRRVFLVAPEKFEDFVPDYWHEFLVKSTDPRQVITNAKRDDASGPWTVGGEVSPPIPLSKPDPSYTPTARKARLQGLLVVYVVVNPEGNVSATRVVKPLGLGLDDQAVATIRTWKFKPGTRGGTPVAVKVLVEVKFRLK